MAIYRLEAKIIGRSYGRSSTAAAAYRSSTRIVDQRTGEIHDYSRKKNVSARKIFFPNGTPPIQRSELWNQIEQIEKRKDAQLAREFIIALPVEFDWATAQSAAIDFAQTLTSTGMVADVCVHGFGTQNPHMHIMTTTREYLSDGSFGKKIRSWNKKEMLQHWRKAWEQIANKHLATDQKISCKSYADQGLDLLPQPKIGPARSAMRKKGQKTNIDEELELIRKHNELQKKVKKAQQYLQENRVPDQYLIDGNLTTIQSLKDHEFASQEFENMIENTVEISSATSLFLSHQDTLFFPSQERAVNTAQHHSPPVRNL